MNITNNPAHILVDMIKRKEISITEVIVNYLEKISFVNSKINAIVQMDADDVLRQAKKADELTLKSKTLGKLHGLPITVKDVCEVKDFFCTSGTQAFADYKSSYDATCVARLRHAGAIILGLTNTPEFATAYETDNLVYGRTNHPLNLSLTPGGSSGGEGAIIAVHGSPLGLGTDAGGSIRIPSHLCGIAGIKPTQGLLPRTGMRLPSRGLGKIYPFSTFGPMGRTVADLELALSVLAGFDVKDPFSVDASGMLANSKIDFKSLRGAFYTDNGISTVIPEIKLAVQSTALLLQAEIPIEEAVPAEISLSYELLWNVFFQGFDHGQSLLNYHKKIGTKNISSLHERFLQSCKKNPLSIYNFQTMIEKIELFRLSMNNFMEKYDFIICPPCARVAYEHGKTFNHLHDFSYAMTYNLTGWPAVVVPVGYTKEGLPIGIQIVAKPWHDHVALGVAKLIEILNNKKFNEIK